MTIDILAAPPSAKAIEYANPIALCECRTPFSHLLAPIFYLRMRLRPPCSTVEIDDFERAVGRKELRSLRVGYGKCYGSDLNNPQ